MEPTIQKATNNDLDAIEQIYNGSFPDDERRDFALVKQLYKASNYFDILAITQNDVTIGFVTMWDFEDFVYMEHFAISPNHRSSGIGAQTMSALLKSLNKRVILEVEPATDSLTERRIKFYERLGFILRPTRYIQPAYSPDKQALEMKLMTVGEFSDNDIQSSIDTILKEVYGIK